jgi:hypothetical protein
MAKIITRVWTGRGPTGKRVRHVSNGYDVRINRQRTVSAERTSEAAALEALNQCLKDADHGKLCKPANATLGALADEYLRYKADRGKRSLREDPRILKTRLLPAFGAARRPSSRSTRSGGRGG